MSKEGEDGGKAINEGEWGVIYTNTDDTTWHSYIGLAIPIQRYPGSTITIHDEYESPAWGWPGGQFG